MRGFVVFALTVVCALPVTAGQGKGERKKRATAGRHPAMKVVNGLQLTPEQCARLAKIVRRAPGREP